MFRRSVAPFKFKFFLISGLVFTSSAFPNPKYDAVIENYADIAFSVYEDSLTEAIKLQKAIRVLVNKPSQAQLEKAKSTWKLARIPYSQSEVFRFGNSIVDDWEGKVNAWPLDEGLIDYVVDENHPAGNWFAAANVIANREINHADYSVSALKVNKTLLETLHSIGDIETNVATGYHAIEFLLWGQDTNGTNKGEGQRPYTDFDRKNCSNDNCFRRGKYLQMAADLLVKDLTWMVKQWEKPLGNKNYLFVQGKEQTVFNVGLARERLAKHGVNKSLSTILIGMGSLAYGELAGERTKLGLLINDPEEEQDCFSDNTHWSHYYNLQGIRNIYFGKYQKLNGEVIQGESLSSILSSSLNKSLEKAFDDATNKSQVIVDSAEKFGVYYDQLLAKDNAEGHSKLNGFVDSLLALTKELTKVVQELKLVDVEFEGSDSLTEQASSRYF